MAGPGFLSTILDTTGKRLQERLDMEKAFRVEQTKAIIDSLHAINEDGTPKLTPEQQEQAWEELNNLNKAKGAKQILGKAREVFDMIGHGKKNPAMAQRIGQQTTSALATQPTEAPAPTTTVPPENTGQTMDEPLPFTPPPPGGRLQPVQATANAVAQQPAQQPAVGPTPPPKRASSGMAQIVAAGSPTGQKMAENAASAQVTAQAQATASKDVKAFENQAVYKKTLDEEKAKLMALYGDQTMVDSIIRMKRLEMPAIPLNPGQGLGVPKGLDANGFPIYEVLGSGIPRIKPPEENLQDAAVLAVLKKHGKSELVDQFNENYPLIQQLPNEWQAEAAMEYERIKKTPDPGLESMRLSMEALRQVEMAHIRQEMDQYNATQGPEAIENARLLVLDNPNAIETVPVNIRGRLTSYMKSRGDRVPRVIPADMQQTEFNADQTLTRLANVRDIISKNPDLIGPVANVMGTGQELSGIAFGSPEKAAEAANLRGSLEFLSAAETKALLGSRPAFQWAEVFKRVTGSQKDQAPVMKGALDMQEAHAKMIKEGIDKQRYGEQPKATPATYVKDGVTYYKHSDNKYYTTPEPKK